jgi:hypothetical protein
MASGACSIDDFPSGRPVRPRPRAAECLRPTRLRLVAAAPMPRRARGAQASCPQLLRLLRNAALPVRPRPAPR